MLQILQYACVGYGLLLVSVVTFAVWTEKSAGRKPFQSFIGVDSAPDQSLWSDKRVRDFEVSLAFDAGVPEAVPRTSAPGNAPRVTHLQSPGRRYLVVRGSPLAPQQSETRPCEARAKTVARKRVDDAK